MVDGRPRYGALTGLDHIGVGVSDMDRSLTFYAELGFTDVAFDYAGPLPGLNGVSGFCTIARRARCARGSLEPGRASEPAQDGVCAGQAHVRRCRRLARCG